MHPFIKKHLEKSRKPTQGVAFEANTSIEYAALVADCRADDNSLRNKHPEHHIRNRYKVGVLKKYLPALEQYLKEPPLPENEVVGWGIIWAADTKEWELLVRLATHCSGSSIELPRGIKRSPTQFAADELFQKLFEPLLKNGGYNTLFDDVLKLIDQQKWAINTPSQAKYYKLSGLHFESMGRDQAALEHYEKAQTAYKDIGVKTRIERLKKHLNALPEAHEGNVSAETSSLPTAPASSDVDSKELANNDRGDAVFLNNDAQGAEE